MDRWSGKTAIVTGASSGIGEAIAEALVKAGMQVVGLARRVEAVQNKAAALSNCKGRLHAVKCDVRCEQDILNAFQWTTKNVGLVHVLVNNAGVLKPTNFIAGKTENWRAALETNVLGLCIAQREACQIMIENGIDGHIININSIAGQAHLYFPEINIYGATKHAVTNICDLMRQELTANKLRIKVTSISPGLVKTELVAPENFSGSARELFATMPSIETKDIADAVLYSLGTPASVMVNEITIRPVCSYH